MKAKRTLKWYQNRVKYLQTKPQPAQRSPEWYTARNTRITASAAACCLPLIEEVCKIYVDTYNIEKFKYNPNKCLSHFQTKEDFIIDKCKSFFGEDVYKDSIYTAHGTKYEEIATRLYRKKFNTPVIEFGLLPHPRLKYLAASPDGITPNGVMLEIKCPFSRKIIENQIPIQYWCQILLQLECTDLDECDFLECEIKELPTEDDFKNCVISKDQDKGIVLYHTYDVKKCIYPPDHLNSEQEFIDWAANIILEYSLQKIDISISYYFIHKWFVLNIKRNTIWFDTIKPYLKKTHTIVTKYQADKELFNNYCDAVYKLKNKKHIEHFNNTVCLIESDPEDKDFVIHHTDNKNGSDDNRSEVTDDIELNITTCIID